MASQTTYYSLTKPAYSEAADIADINANMDIIDAALHDNAAAIENQKAAIGYVEDTNTSTHAISAGQYVLWKGSLYVASAAIPSGTTLSSSNLTAITNGGVNDLRSKVLWIASQSLTTAQKNQVKTNIGVVNMTGASSSAAGAAGLVPAPGSGKNLSFLRGDGTWVVPDNTTYSDFTAASSSAAGTHGLVPAPAKGKQNSFLRGDKTWSTPTNTWRGYQFKSYSYSYTVSANAVLGITGTNFSVSTPSGYTPAAILQITTGSTDTSCISFRANQTGSEWVLRIKNMTSSSVSATAFIQVLYLQND